MNVSELARSVAAYGLPGAASLWPTQELPPVHWEALLARVREQRLAGLLLDAVESGMLPALPEQVAQAADLHVDAACSVLFLESTAVQVVGELAEHGLPARILKGTAYAHLDYPDVSWRLFGDVDLLVRSADLDAVNDVLARSGYVRRSVEPRKGFDRRFGKGATFTSPDGHEVDVHRTFVMGPFGLRIDLDHLWERSSSFSLGGVQVEALDPECRFLHACFHTALGNVPARLVPQRDLAQMLLFGELDPTRVRHLMRAWQAEPVVARAVRMAWETLRLSDITALSAWSERFQPDRRAVKDLAVYVDPQHSSYAAKSVASLGALTSTRDRAAFALALSMPRRGFVPEDAEGSAVRPWRRALRAGLRRATPPAGRGR